MCGICGSFSLNGAAPDAAAMRAVRDAFAHRGPDDEGEHLAPGHALGFRRLSILDLEHGGQPMTHESGGKTLVFNGEIYNHPQLKLELEAAGERYRTRADTETVLRLLAREGAAALKKFNGMFAIGYADEAAGELLLARDHAGMKPLYYTVRGGSVLFSSELRALLKGGVPAGIDPAAAADYLDYGFVHSPLTIIRGVYKLPPGHFIRFRRGAAADPGRIERFSTLGPDRERGLTGARAARRLDELLNESVKSHLQGDVKMGAFLSGGVDSGLLTALMRRHYPGELRTYCIKFAGLKAGMDESAAAAALAKRLGTVHREVELPRDFLRDIGALMPALDEPLCDSAAFPVYLLSRAAAGEVKVALSGEGADELFAGYRSYRRAWRRAGLWGLAAKFPGGRFVSDEVARLVSRQPPVVPHEEWAALSRQSSARAAVLAMLPEAGAPAADGPPRWFDVVEKAEGFNGLLIFDTLTHLADSLLMKADKAAMAAGLELRMPYLDKEVMKFAFALPPADKLSRGRSKWILRRVAKDYLPPLAALRRKHGLWTQWEEWIRSRPEAVAAAFGAGGALARHGFPWRRALKALDELAAGTRGADAGLVFRVAMLALWLESL